MTTAQPGDLSPTVPNPYYLTACFSDPELTLKPVKFGTSGHRGKLGVGFHERHVLAVAQAVADFRATSPDYDGFCLIGGDTRLMSPITAQLAAEVLIGNGQKVRLAQHPVPTPVFSTMVLHGDVCDAIIGTASHNPPDEMGIKYNPSHGGPADPTITGKIQADANMYLAHPERIKRTALADAGDLLDASPDLYTLYFERLAEAVDMKAVAESDVQIRIHPLGGAALPYFQRLAEMLPNLTLVNDELDPMFGFVPLDHDGVIRMDPSSKFPMGPLLNYLSEGGRLMAAATDPDADRFGVATPGHALLTPNQALCVAADYLLSGKYKVWPESLTLGRTIGTTHLLDRIARKYGRPPIDEVDVGFKHFVKGLTEDRYALVGEESAGLSFYNWTTEKDGIAAVLLFAEIMTKTGKDLWTLYQEIEQELGVSYYNRTDLKADDAFMDEVRQLKEADIAARLDLVDWQLAGTPVNRRMSTTDGIKMYLEEDGKDVGFVLVRPSGTENIVKFYTESFISAEHRATIEQEARTLVGI